MRSPLNSLRGRFVVAILLWTVLGIGAIWYSSVHLFKVHVEEHYHEELAVHVEELAALTELDAVGNPILSRPLSDPRYAVSMSGFYWQVTRAGHKAIHSNSMKHGVLEDTIAASPKIAHRLATGPTGPTIAYGLSKPVANGAPLRIVLATDERHLLETVEEFSEGLGLTLLALAAALLASGIAIITFGLRPLKSLSLAISNLRSGKVARLVGAYPNEISPLVSDLNGYAEHCEVIVKRGRVQAGNLAHALRTPLAVMTDEAERMLEAQENIGRAVIFLDESRRMQRQIDYHLARSKSSGSASAMGSSVHLSAVLTPILTAMRRIYPERFFTVETSVEPPPIACDHDDLHEILSNLFDNAGKWASMRIKVIWESLEDHVAISVIDDGPGIEVHHREHVFEVGIRLDDEFGGSGLGLAVSRDIVRDYGGTLAFESTDGGAFAAIVKLPIAEKIKLSPSHR